MIKLHYKLRFKHKKKRYKVFNAEISNDTVFFFLDLENKNKINDEIIALFKKIVNKILKFK